MGPRVKKNWGAKVLKKTILWLLVIGIGYWYWLLVFVSPPGGGPVINFARPYLYLKIRTGPPDLISSRDPQEGPGPSSDTPPKKCQALISFWRRFVPLLGPFLGAKTASKSSPDRWKWGSRAAPVSASFSTSVFDRFCLRRWPPRTVKIHAHSFVL